MLQFMRAAVCRPRLPDRACLRSGKPRRIPCLYICQSYYLCVRNSMYEHNYCCHTNNVTAQTLKIELNSIMISTLRPSHAIIISPPYRKQNNNCFQVLLRHSQGLSYQSIYYTAVPVRLYCILLLYSYTPPACTSMVEASSEGFNRVDTAVLGLYARCRMTRIYTKVRILCLLLCTTNAHNYE